MGMSSDFFVVSPNELHTVFPGWLPAADKPTTREAVNPFTGKKQLFPYWPPVVDPPQYVSPASLLPDYRHVSHISWGRIDQSMLTELNVILNGGEFDDCFSQFNRPALIHPGDYDGGMHRLDHEFVVALAAMTATDTIAQRWAATKVMQDIRNSVDVCLELLHDLNRLAQEAHTSGKGLYYLWSL